MIEIKNISKRFKNNIIYKDFSLNVLEHQVILLTGQNGCGKSTLLHLIAGHIPLDKGSIIRKDKCFYLPEKLFFLTHLKVYDIIFKILLKDEEIKKANYYIEKFKLANKKIGKLSKGNIQKIGIILALSQSAPILLLDEPLEGLDSEIIKLFILLLRMKIGHVLFQRII